MLIVVSGGSGSGKSAYAEKLAQSMKNGPLLYIATMLPLDAENRARIKKHRKLRAGKGFQTIECFMGLEKLEIPKNSTVLLECLSNLTANEMFCAGGAGENTYEAVRNGIRHLEQCASNVILVTNEIFSDGGNYDRDTRKYLKVLGNLNVYAASAAAQVVEVVYGIPVWKKGSASILPEGAGDF